MDLKQFLELFNPLPGNHYIQITTKIDETSFALEKLMQGVDGEFRLAYYGEEEASHQEYLPNTRFQYINSFKYPFRALPRDNDMVVFKDIIHLLENKEKLLKIAYTTLANTAQVIIMQEKGTMDIEATLELLDTLEFRAPNYVDVLDEYDLVIAKKMHMWGNGL